MIASRTHPNQDGELSCNPVEALDQESTTEVTGQDSLVYILFYRLSSLIILEHVSLVSAPLMAVYKFLSTILNLSQFIKCSEGEQNMPVPNVHVDYLSQDNQDSANSGRPFYLPFNCLNEFS